MADSQEWKETIWELAKRLREHPEDATAEEIRRLALWNLNIGTD